MMQSGQLLLERNAFVDCERRANPQQGKDHERDRILAAHIEDASRRDRTDRSADGGEDSGYTLHRAETFKSQRLDEYQRQQYQRRARGDTYQYDESREHPPA